MPLDPAPALAPDVTTCVVEGEVVDEMGQPVAGAIVTLEPRALELVTSRQPEAISAADGRFSCEPVACDAFFVTANAPGLVTPFPESVELSDAEPVASVTLVLRRGGHQISGQVSDSGGGGVARAEVRVRSQPSGGAYATRTDDDGAYALALPTGSYLFTVKAHGYAPLTRRRVIDRDQTLDFLLDPAGTVRGRVIRAADGSPASGARVSALSRDGGQSASTLSGPQGLFELSHLAAGRYDLEAALGDLRGRHPRAVKVHAASYASGITIALETGLAMRGWVLDQDGEGVADALVVWQVSRSAGAQTHAGPDGAFTLLGLSPGTGNLVASRFGYAPGHEPVVLKDRDIEGIEIALTLGAQVRGTVVDADEQPVAGAVVSAVGEGGVGFGPLRRLGAVFDTTGGDGRFLLDGLAPGAAQVSAQHVHLGFASQRLEGLEPGQVYEVELVLAASASVSGRVTWESGEPALGASVHALSQGLNLTGPVSVEVGATGEYHLAGLEPRDYLLWASPPDLLAPNGEPAPSAETPQRQISLGPEQHLTGVNLVLGRASGTISGQVVDVDGAPVSGAIVGADLLASTFTGSDFAGSRRMGEPTTSAADGSFTIVGLVNGFYNVWASVPDFGRGEQDGVRPGDTNVRVVIPPGGSLAGVVLDRGGSPLAPYELSVVLLEAAANWPRRDANRRESVVDPSGRFEVRNLHAASYRLVAVTPAGLLGELPEVAVAAGERLDGLEIQVDDAASLRGAVTAFAGGVPVANASVLIVTHANESQVETDAAGEFEVSGVATGEAMIMVRADPGLYLEDRFGISVQMGENAVQLRLVELAALPTATAAPPLVVNYEGGRLVVSTTVREVDERMVLGRSLVAVDGTQVQGLGADGIMALWRGPPGSSIQLSLASDVDGAPYTIGVARLE